MDILKKLFAVYLVGASLVVAAHFLVSSAFQNYDSGPVWDVIDWFMALAVVAALIGPYGRKRTLYGSGPDGGITRDYLEINLLFYATALLALWFFWNWFDNLAAGAGSVQSDNHLLVWVYINPLFALVTGVTGCQMWCGASRREP